MDEFDWLMGRVAFWRTQLTYWQQRDKPQEVERVRGYLAEYLHRAAYLMEVRA